MHRIAPKIWGTITFADYTPSAKQVIDRVCKNLCKKHDVHAKVDMHEDIQLMRYNKFAVEMPDFHFVIGFRGTEINLLEFCKDFDMLAWIFGAGKTIKLNPYNHTLHDGHYSFDHKDYFGETYCNHSTKCRRRGCIHKKGDNLLEMPRTW